MNKKMKRDFEELLKKHNGKWKVKDFERLIVELELKNKIVLEEARGYNEQKIVYIHNPKVFKELMKKSG